jgi:folate-binding protein YgfZ
LRAGLRCTASADRSGSIRTNRWRSIGLRRRKTDPIRACWLAPADAPASGWLEHRLRLGVAEGRAELGTDKTLWLECNAAELGGVSFTKGCYVGQENTARMNYRQKVNRRLMVVPADAPGERTRAHYPELGLAVEHRRMDDLGGAIVPVWLAGVVRAEPVK